MEPQVVAAVVTGLLGLVAAVTTAIVALVTSLNASARQKATALDVERLREEAQARRVQEQRARDAGEQLDLYREPLLMVAKDLTFRLRNIRAEAFLSYARSSDHRGRTAVLGTLYRLGAYWGTVDRLYGTVNLLQFERSPATKDVAGLLDSIASTFASDDEAHGRRLLMVWREEQRAIAELMQQGAPPNRTVIGFASFVQRYPVDLAPWFVELEQALMTPGTEASPRLRALQELLDRLVTHLERDRIMP